MFWSKLKFKLHTFYSTFLTGMFITGLIIMGVGIRQVHDTIFSLPAFIDKYVSYGFLCDGFSIAVIAFILCLADGNKRIK